MNRRSKAIAAQFRFSPAGGEDSDVRACMESYLAAWGHPIESRSMANRWTRVSFGSEVVAVVGEIVQPGIDILYLVDLYPGAGRNGILGVYAVVEVVKNLVDTGAISGISWMSAVQNEAHTRALKQVLGVTPTMYLWTYGAMAAAGSAGLSGPSPKEDAILGVGSDTLNRVCRDIFAAG